MNKARLLALGLLLPAVLEAGGLQVENAWSRAMPPNINTGAVYLRLCNAGALPRAVIRMTTPVAARAELHQHVERAGVLSMQEVAELRLEPGECRQLRPGGDHLMLFGIGRPLQAGGSYPLTLELDDGTLLHLDFRVLGPGQRPGSNRQSEPD